MEIYLILGLVGAVTFFVLVLRKPDQDAPPSRPHRPAPPAQSDRPAPPSRPDRPAAPVAPPHRMARPAFGFDLAETPRPSAPDGERRAFDPGTAHAVPARPVLRGPAYIVDGDTIVIRKTQIRLFGIDAPELDHPYGKKAKSFLFTICKGHAVRAEILEQDVHGRTVARCTLDDGRDLSAEMVRAGLAIDWPKFSGGIYRGLETPDARKRLWLADARQKGRMHVWEAFEARRAAGRG